MAQNYYEILLGLYEKRESDLEQIQEARERFVRIKFIIQFSLSNSTKKSRQTRKLRLKRRITKITSLMKNKIWLKKKLTMPNSIMNALLVTSWILV